MIIDYLHNQLVITEEGKERLITLQDHMKFVLCERIRDRKFEVPFVSLPLLVSAAKEAQYTLKYTDRLVEANKKNLNKRNTLLALRNSSLTVKHPTVEKIIDLAHRIEKEHGFTLTPEQLETVVFGIAGKTVLIGNEIGTGKTLSVNTICKILSLSGNLKKILVLVPASLVENYSNDYVKFFGSEGMISCRKQTPQKRLEIYRKFYSNHNLKFLITNYEKCYFDYDILSKMKFDAVIVDEFHNMKNFMSAKRSINFFNMMKIWNPKYRFPMTGTPIENSLFDLYPTFKFLDDGHILGGQRFFENNFVVWEEQFYRRRQGNRIVTGSNMKAVDFKNHEFLKDMIRPYIIRKKLKMPVDLYENFIPLDLPKEYEDAIDRIKGKVEGGSARYHAIRQFLCDSSREGVEENIRHQKVLDIANQTSEKMLIFSFYKCSLHSLKPFLEAHGHKCMTYCGDDTKEVPTEVIAAFKKSDDKCLIVTDILNYGHNIQFARIVIQYEMPMKPTIYFQRNGRCYRTGQIQDVHVYSFYFTDCVEEVIKENLDRKHKVLKTVFFDLDKVDPAMLAAETQADADFERKIYESLE